MTVPLLSNATLLLVIAIAVFIDWRTTKVPNWLTFPAAVIGLVFNVVTRGWLGALSAVSGWFVGAIATLFFANLPIGPKYASQKIGMGDVKLLAAVGAFVGPRTMFIVLFYFCLSYGLISMVEIARVIPWKQVFIQASALAAGGKISMEKVDTSQLTIKRKSLIPIALAIFMGTLLSIAFRQETMHLLGLS
jgi:prepilin peptidase CpaA